ncbi:MAG: hypothetical protein IT289_07200 [Oligoflexia bacterium]|nr:hypothetical protein [Oligoflexia bacterium]
MINKMFFLTLVLFASHANAWLNKCTGELSFPDLGLSIPIEALIEAPGSVFSEQKEVSARMTLGYGDPIVFESVTQNGSELQFELRILEQDLLGPNPVVLTLSFDIETEKARVNLDKNGAEGLESDLECRPLPKVL